MRIFTLIISETKKDWKPVASIEYRDDEISLIEVAQILPILIQKDAGERIKNQIAKAKPMEV